MFGSVQNNIWYLVNQDHDFQCTFTQLNALVGLGHPTEIQTTRRLSQFATIILYMVAAKHGKVKLAIMFLFFHSSTISEKYALVFN